MNKGLKRVLQIGIPVVIVGAIVIPRLDFSSDKESQPRQQLPRRLTGGFTGIGDRGIYVNFR